MFETVELGRKLSKSEYKKREPTMRQALLKAQRDLRQSGIPAVVLFGGVDGAGKEELVNLLNAWMDPRWVLTRAYGEASDEERERPPYWRYWRDLPPAGQIGLFLSAWYSRPLLDRVYGGAASELDESLDEISTFEKMLADDGVLVLKFWMHLGKDAQRKRFKALEKDPLQSWRVTDRDWKHWEMYEQFVETAERIIARTSTGAAPWYLIEGADERYRSMRVGQILLGAIQRRLDRERTLQRARMRATGDFKAVVEDRATRDAKLVELARAEAEAIWGYRDAEGDTAAPAAEPAEAAEPVSPAGAVDLLGAGDDDAVTDILTHPITVFSRLEMPEALDTHAYKEDLAAQQARASYLHRLANERQISTILVFEGVDAAGKGGAIRRLISALDMRNVRVIPIAKPTDEENAHHYLWRFWRHLPRGGRLTIFDRSWYGRVLVERVEGFAGEEEWRRAYEEINRFESQLTSHGAVLIKFWVHITPEEQLDRFKARMETPYKRWKLTDEDWRNRARWHDYEIAAHDMMERTSRSSAPWVLVEGNDKRFARVKVIKTVCDRLAEALGEDHVPADHGNNKKKKGKDK